MSATIMFHFDGPLVEHHQISLRVLGSTLTSLQSAIDRAYLDITYEGVWKYARLKKTDYPHVDFIVGQPRDGGYILDIFKEAGQQIVRRIYEAVDAVTEADYQEGIDDLQRLSAQVQTRQDQLKTGVWQGRSLADYQSNPGQNIDRKYGDRSIGKEIDQLLIPIRRPQPEGESPNTLELEFKFDGARPYTFKFDQSSAHAFHSKISRRELGEPLLYTGTLQAIDRGNQFSKPKAKFTLSGSNRIITVHMSTEEEYQTLAPHMQGRHEIAFYACPILEFNSFDSNSGDIFFISLATPL